jgi:hypothetical protein
MLDVMEAVNADLGALADARQRNAEVVRTCRPRRQSHGRRPREISSPSFLIFNKRGRSHKTDLIDLNVSLRRLRRLRHGRDFRVLGAMSSSN